jgi:hypothetical protein
MASWVWRFSAKIPFENDLDDDLKHPPDKFFQLEMGKIPESGFV